MDRVVSTDMINNLPEFTLAEIMEMESLYKEKCEECLTMKFCLQLATRFSFSTYRSGKLTLHWKQVQSWFQDKHQRLAAAKVTTPSLSFRQFVFSSNNDAAQGSSSAALKQTVRSDIPISDDAARNSQKSKGERVAELSELIFEALSSKDCAWYDVASFLNYRIVYSGELEVRVRFSGFSHEEDEWVNVRRGIRERSIPLEPSECHRIKVGDRVLCFRENDDHALYSDARILDVQRNSHDRDSCSCTFVVAYDYDNAEAKVDMNQICCRPT